MPLSLKMKNNNLLNPKKMAIQPNSIVNSSSALHTNLTAHISPERQTNPATYTNPAAHTIHTPLLDSHYPTKAIPKPEKSLKANKI